MFVHVSLKVILPFVQTNTVTEPHPDPAPHQERPQHRVMPLFVSIVKCFLSFLSLALGESQEIHKLQAIKKEKEEEEKGMVRHCPLKALEVKFKSMTDHQQQKDKESLTRENLLLVRLNLMMTLVMSLRTHRLHLPM